MPSQPEKPIYVGDAVRLPSLGSPGDSAHYVRQATITMRRHSTWLNQMWCRKRYPVTEATAWKH